MLPTLAHRFRALPRRSTSTISSLIITDRSFRYASPRLCRESTPWFIPSASPVMSRLTSSFTCQLIAVIITTLIIHHSFTLSLQAQNLPFQHILPTLIFLQPWTAFMITGPDRIYHASRFIFSSLFSLFFSVCSVWWTKLTRQLFTARQIHNIMVLYRILLT